MLLNFSVGNYLSFKSIQSLNLVPDALKELKENLHTPYLYDPNDKVLKSIAIYGHNSHGKSNFIRAFQFLRDFIFSSFSLGQTQSQIDVEPFRLNTEMLNRPSFFEITFLIKETKYRYQIQLNAEKVIAEGLYYAESGIRENYLFERVEKDIKVSKSWNKDNGNKIENLVPFAKQHVLFLSVLLSQDNINRVQEIAKWFNASMIIPDEYKLEFTKARTVYSDIEYRPLILKFIEKADLGFTTIFDKIENTQRGSRPIEKGLLNMWYDSEMKNFDLYTKHIVFDEHHKQVNTIEFELEKNESAGSIKYFIIVCLLAYAIKNNQLIWIDELDARFHSDLLEMLVTSFHDPKMNAINAQMIFTTHNTILMDKKLRRDQMVAVTKNEWGESELGKMHTSKKPIKIGKSVEREYRKGNLSGVSKKIKKDLGPELFDDL